MKYLIIILILTGCMTPKKAVDVLSRPKNEPVLSELCAYRFPVKDSIIKGDSVIRFDTLWETYTDTIRTDPQVIIYTDSIKVPKLVTKTIYVRDTIVRENTAKVAFLNSQIAELGKSNRVLSEKNAEISQERDGYRSERNKARLINWILYVVIGLAIGYGIKRKFKLF